MKRSTLVFLLGALPLFAANEVRLQSLPISSCVNCDAIWRDFNGDGLDDVLVRSGMDDEKRNRLQFNLGGGQLAPPMLIEEVSAFPADYVVFAGDFNGDGNADLIVNGAGQTQYGGPGPDGYHRLLLGDGTGHFPTEMPLPATRSRTYQVADFTGDGKLDLLQLDRKTKEILIYRGNGDGTFTFHQALDWPFNQYEFLGRYSDPVIVADINGDARPDLVIASNPGHLNFFFQQPDGKFAPRVERYTRNDVYEMKIGDVNGDGKADLVFALPNPPYSRFVVLLGDGTGRFPVMTEMTITDERGPSVLEIGDFIAGGGNEIATSEQIGPDPYGSTVVVYAMQNDRLREVARTTFPASGGLVTTARFRSNQPELLAYGYAHNRGVAFVMDSEGEIAAAPSRPHSRTRTIGRATSFPDGEYTVAVDSRCSISGLNGFTLAREGMFVDFAASPIEKVEGVFLDGVIYTKYTIREGDRTRVLDGTLVPDAGGRLTGKLIESGDTPCGGWQVYRVTAVPRGQ